MSRKNTVLTMREAHQPLNYDADVPKSGERKTKRSVVPEDENGDDSPWQQRAVDRSIRAARDRAVSRSSTFLSSALQLLEETGGTDFTVQNVVDRSELSLRAFYQHFGSKDELLLSLFEELLNRFTDQLAARLEGVDDPFEQLETYVRGFLEQAHASLPYGGRAWTIYQLRLATEQPGDYVKSVVHQVEVLQGLIVNGIDQGVFRSDLSPRTLTLLVNGSLVSIAQMDVLDIQAGGTPVGADDLLSWCRAALQPPTTKPGAAKKSATKKSAAKKPGTKKPAAKSKR